MKLMTSVGPLVEMQRISGVCCSGERLILIRGPSDVSANSFPITVVCVGMCISFLRMKPVLMLLRLAKSI